MPEINKPADGGDGNGANGAGDDKRVVGQPEAPKKLELTQDELDRIIADRLSRAKPKDYDDLVALRARVDAEEDAKKTAEQKAKDAQAEAERKATEKISRADARLKQAAIMTEAAAQGASDVDIVTTLLAGSDAIAVDDEGNVTGVKEAVKKLLKDKPVLVKGAPSASGGEFGGNDPKTLPERIRELEVQGKYSEARDLKLEMGLRQGK